MEQQTNYQFVMIPQQLSSCLDANCSKMLTTLIGLSSLMSKEDGWFYRSNKELQLDTRFSQNLVIATLDTLYQAGIINVDCIGKGRGHRSNRIHINYDSFGVYQQYSFNEIRNNPDLWIETVPYKNHYSPSYLNKGNETGKEIGNTLGKRIGKKVTTNTDTTDTTNTLENNILLVNETREKVSTQKELPSCKIDIVEEEKSLKEFEEETLKDMKDSFHVECSKIKINDDLKVKGFKCCEDFLSRNQNLDYQLLLRNSQQFLEDNDFKLTMLTQRISLDTGVTFSKKITTELLKEYVVGKTA